jgi:hypothetical protein
METKRCSRCKGVKPVDSFGKLRASPDGRSHYCKPCKGAMNRAAYVANADARRAYRTAKHALNRDQENAERREAYARDPAIHRAKATAYAAKHRDKNKAYARSWRAAHPDYQPTYNKRYAQEHAEEIAAYGKTYREANRPKMRAYLEKFRRENPERALAMDTRSKLAKYGMTPSDFDQMLAAQGGRCPICGVAQASIAKRFAVDHEHVPGYPKMPREEKRKHSRGLLCDPCNKMIGHFKDSPALLRTAAAYVRRHEKGARP